CQDFNVGGGSGSEHTECGTAEDGEVFVDPFPCPPGSCCLLGFGCICVAELPCTCTDPDWCIPGTITAVECAGRNGAIASSSGLPCLPGCAVCGFDDRLGAYGNRARAANIPSMPIRDGIYTPGERYRDVYEDGRYNALYEPPMDADVDGVCDPDEEGSSDYFDVDEDGERDLPEPFEDFMVRWDPFMYNGAGEWVTVTQQYVRSNYPLNPTWDVELEILYFLGVEFGYICDVEADPLTETDLTCVYFAQEMFRLREIYDPVAGVQK
ncbi:unnamed protein product, partial [marine sediment metagenome]